MDNNSKSARILVDAGIANPARVVKKIRETIELLQLDLTGLSVLTEAASGPFVVTPIIAALAGAREVIAVTADSRYSTAAEVVRQTRALESLCGVEGQIEVHIGRDMALFLRADIVTNLGFVRPLDRQSICHMKPGTVIALMCEAWEIRESDIDLAACRESGIAVFGTNEDFPGLDVFAYSGWVALQLLLEAQIEIYKSRIAVIGSDKFASTIGHLLQRLGANASVHPGLESRVVRDVDALLIADYSRSDFIIGKGGDITPIELASLNPTVTVVQFAGSMDIGGLRKAGITVYPGYDLVPRRMAHTLAVLGPRPVIELHAAGLKVGRMGGRHQLGAAPLHSFSTLAQRIV